MREIDSYFLHDLNGSGVHADRIGSALRISNRLSAKWRSDPSVIWLWQEVPVHKKPTKGFTPVAPLETKYAFDYRKHRRKA